MRQVFLLAFRLAVSQVAADLPPGGNATPSTPSAPLNALSGLTLEELIATRERPLFSPSRRPPRVPNIGAAPAAPAAAPGPPPFDLIGSAVGPLNSFVLVRDRATNEVMRLHTSEERDGWRVGAINLRSVALERQGRMQTVGLANPAVAGPTSSSLSSDSVQVNDAAATGGEASAMSEDQLSGAARDTVPQAQRESRRSPAIFQQLR